MKNKLSIFLFLLCTSYVIAQVERNSTLTELESFIKESSTLSTDRDIYFAGEEICFSVYNFINEIPANKNLSKVIYIELFSHQQSILKHKFTLQNGQVSGILNIPEELETANYFIRAYTNYERNRHPETFFTKVVRIINPNLPLPPFQFFKDEHIKFTVNEGNLAPGQLSTITYFIHPILIENATRICLVNQEDSCINLLKSLENGLGEISFIPSKEGNYFIQIKLENDQIINQKLIRENKLLQVKSFSSDKFLRLNIGLLNSETDNFSDSLQLIIKSQNLKNTGLSKFKLNAGLASIKVDPSILVTGINYALIQDLEGQILHIHPIFQKPQNLVQLPIKLNKNSFTARELISSQISLPDRLKYATVSIAVVKRGSKHDFKHLPYFLAENIILLNSWIKNNAPGNDLNNEIGLLMKLHEKEINSLANSILLKKQKQTKTFWLPETRGVSISGLVRHKVTKKTQQNIKLILSVLGDNPQTHFTNTQSDGSFVFALKNLYGPQSVSIKIDDFSSNNLEVLINKDFATLPSLQNSEIWFSKTKKEDLNKILFSRQIEQAFNHNRTETLTRPYLFKNLWIYDTTIYMKDYVASENMEQLIDEVVPFVHAREDDGDFKITVQDKEVLSTYTSPFVLLDNYPVKNINELLKLNPKVIEKVSVIYSPYHSGDRKLNGIVSFFTKTNNFGGYPTNQSTVFLDFITEDIPQKKEFKSYNSDHISKALPDFRNLLYWNPNLKISETTELSFYASDDRSTYNIVLQGYSQDGKLIFGQTSFMVKNP